MAALRGWRVGTGDRLQRRGVSGGRNVPPGWPEGRGIRVGSAHPDARRLEAGGACNGSRTVGGGQDVRAKRKDTSPGLRLIGVKMRYSATCCVVVGSQTSGLVCEVNHLGEVLRIQPGFTPDCPLTGWTDSGLREHAARLSRLPEIGGKLSAEDFASLTGWRSVASCG